MPEPRTYKEHVFGVWALGRFSGRFSGTMRERHYSSLDLLSTNIRQDVRAHQRTYEGAYTRSALSCLSFSLVVIKMFLVKFLAIAAVYTAYGLFLYVFGVANAGKVHEYYARDSGERKFRTAGDSVLLLSSISLCAYVALLVLVARV